MDCQIAKAINLDSQPVAVIKTDTIPEHALQFKEGKWGCVVALLASAAQGRITACSRKTTCCPGGNVGLGFQPFPSGIEYFLSVGGKGPREGEFYKETPELAKAYITSVPEITAKEAVVFKPLNLLEKAEKPEAIVFLVNADQLSALVTLANYDRPTQDNVRIKFGAGCNQALLYPMSDQEAGNGICTIGLTDPSARKCIDKALLSFSIPYHRFLEMESKVSGSFLTKDTWLRLSERI